MKTKPSSVSLKEKSKGGEAEAPILLEAKCQNAKGKREERYSQAIKAKSDKYLLCTAMHLVLLQGLRA